MANGLESDSSRIGPINPAALIGSATPIVEPRAVSALSEAFRSGLITADDIMQRAGEAGKLKQKAEIQMLSEQISPEAVAARAQTQQAAAAQARLQGTQATAQLPLVTPTAQLAATQLEEQAAIQKYGPGIEYFKVLAPEAGVAAPVTPDGQPDYAPRAQLGLRLFEWKQKKELAKSRLTPDPRLTQESPDGSNVFFFNSQGERIEDLKSILTPQATAPFSQVTPGTVAEISAQSSTPAQPVIEVTPEQRAAAVEHLGVAPERAAVLTSAEMQALVQPRITPTATPTILPATPIQPTVTVPGASFFLGPAKTRPTDKKIERTEAEQLGSLQADRIAIQAARNLLSEANVVGPGAGSGPVRVLNQVGAALGFRAQEFESQDRLLQLINKRVLEGARELKGNLSDKDIRFLQESFPSLRSTENTWTDFLGKWEQMIGLNEQIIRGAAPKGASIFDTAEQSVLAQPSATTPGSSGGVLSLPSTGRRIVRDANGNYRLVQ